MKNPEEREEAQDCRNRFKFVHYSPHGQVSHLQYFAENRNAKPTGAALSDTKGRAVTGTLLTKNFKSVDMGIS